MCLLRNNTRLKHTLHTSLLRGMVQKLHSKGLSFKALFFAFFKFQITLCFQGFLQADEPEYFFAGSQNQILDFFLM